MTDQSPTDPEAAPPIPAAGSPAPAPRVTFKVRKRLAILTLDAPPLNVVDFPLMRDMRGALKGIRQSGVTVVIIRSAIPSVFSAGVDVKIHTRELAPRMLKEFHSVLRAILKAPAVFVAEVDGVCLGGGFELVLACDFAFASPGSTFAFPEIDVGCFPPFAAAVLPRMAPGGAADLIFTGRKIGPRVATRLGLVHHTLKDPQAGARQFAEALCTKSGAALVSARRAMRLGLRAPSIPKALARIERVYARRVTPSHDAAEGIAAFLQKRSPDWRHR